MYLDHFSAILGFTFESAQCNRKSAICGLKIPGGGGDELVNRSYRDRAADDLGHRDVTRNLDSASEIVSWFQEVKVETLR